MLITTCAHCQARFRVTPQQLNVKQGQVRCGRCNKVFSGFAALERFPDDDTGARLLAAREAEERARGEIHGTVELPPPAAAVAPEMTLPPAATAEEPRREADAPARPASTRRAEVVFLEAPEPPPRPSRWWSFGTFLLAVALLGELAYAYRGPLAQHYPALRPALEAACARLSCTVPYSRDHALLKLEDSELLEVPGRPGEIALGARIRNLAGVAQEYPHVELTLTDISGQAAARRVLRPADYVGRALAPDEVLAPGVELALQLRLASPNIRATGYQLLLFYP